MNYNQGLRLRLQPLIAMIFYLWVAVMLAAIIAVPVAMKLSPEVQRSGGDDEMMDDAAVDEFAAGEEPAVDAFGTAEPLADDAFEEFQ